MRILILFIFCLSNFVVHAQHKVKLIEGGIGFNNYTNLNSRQYVVEDIGGVLPLSISFEGLHELKWNQIPSKIREYNLGLTFLIHHSRDYTTEWLGSLNLVGQFQRNIILSATFQSLKGVKSLDSSTTMHTLDHNLMLVSSYNDLLFFQPALGWRRHLNRRLNLRADLKTSFGKSILHGFDVSMFSGTVERVLVNDKLISQQTTYDAQSDLPPKFIALPQYFAMAVNLALGVEYRLFEHRSIFIGGSGSIGKQFQFLNPYGVNFSYVGGEMRLISRF